MTHLINLLPTLALLAMGLTGLENAPTTALAHVQRSPQDLHRHLATRQRLTGNIGAKERRKGSIRQSKRGATCRPRVDAAASALVSAAESPSASPVPASASPSPSATQVASAAAQNVNVNAAVQSPSPTQAPAASTAASSADSAASTGSNGNLFAIGASVANQGSKFGAAWPNGNWAQSTDPNYVGNYIGSRTAWYYTWSPSNVGSADSLGLEFVPMLWGPAQVSDFWSTQGSWPSSVKNALFFNEPNEVSQCNIDAGSSVQYWMNEMVPLRSNKGIAIGGAATTNAPSGLQWVQDIISLCQQDGNSQADCTPDFVPIHWYSTDLNEFQQYVQNFNQQTGLDIWVTEYACQSFTDAPQCDNGQTWQLHQAMAAWFDTQDYVKRYSPFGMMENMQGVNQDNALMNPSGSITDLGSWVSGIGNIVYHLQFFAPRYRPRKMSRLTLPSHSISGVPREPLHDTFLSSSLALPFFRLCFLPFIFLLALS
ncbi:glycosyl hydrolase catalytic core-domain-containing protein [Kockovaella imperatae]|uniref:Glycosyl hydrolase catalytic core-domain-containing protein n=1 Tax=Kockovaella imperatae TaxID=4999 RepID=A0A1Y1UR48_9TREE|nr:glycosyl hydrolase catalytic core-domain-containing protein [Kockovaella imperatae]ORX39964.1 glycosyl hydrolase catalytic core-domain-containing protein [Kockovaella imperatae]